MDLKAIASRFRFKRKGKLHQMPSRTRLQVWCVRVTSSILLWTCIIQLMALGELWRPHLPTCFNSHRAFSAFGVSNLTQFGVPPTPEFIQSASVADLPLPRTYKSNGYLEVSCNGGLNQMRAAICDMVTVAHYLNLTLVVPELDKTSFWADPSDFGDIFDVNHFMTALRGELRIVKKLPKKYVQRPRYKPLVMAPVSWSNEKYYLKQILPLFRKHKVVHFNRTDARLANNNLPIQLQKLRCKVNYHALKFTPKIEKLGQKIVRMLREKGPFVVLHLRYEMDMLAFSGCTHSCTEEEANELKQMRYAYPWWKEKEIDSNQKRLEGLCPLTPEETALVLKALGLDRNIQIYIAAGRIYGGERRLAVLRSIYPNIVRKEMLLRPCELEPLQNHSSQMAALDYLVSIESDIFIPTYDGNMAKVVEGHRRHLGFQKTFLLDRKQLVGLLDMYQNKTLQWQEFSNVVKKLHKNRTGMPARRKAIAEKPKEEDYFYANPQECLCNNRSCTM